MAGTTTESSLTTGSFGAELARQAALLVEETATLTEEQVKVLIAQDFLSIILLLKRHYGARETSRIIKEAWITSEDEESQTS